MYKQIINKVYFCYFSWHLYMPKKPSLQAIWNKMFCLHCKSKELASGLSLLPNEKCHVSEDNEPRRQ